MAEVLDLQREGQSQWYCDLQEDLAYLGKDIEGFSHTYHQLQTKASKLAKEFRGLQGDFSDLKKSNDELEVRQRLIALLLSARNESPGIFAFRDALYKDFIAFANSEGSLQNEAETILLLQEIEKELEVISSYPGFHSKHSVAIAGGFSSGKSEFISSFFADKTLRLPIGIEPTTAIPVYILNGSGGTQALGLSSMGGMVDLLEIDSDFSHKLSHSFIRSFGFNLKNIMPFVFLITTIGYENLCFVDTPGYNPSSAQGGFQGEDVKTAETFVNSSHALIWLIGLDSNGTISRSDLDFLENISDSSSKPLYIVLNKADLRPHDQLEEIMDDVADTLDDFDIEFYGMSAYSSVQNVEFTYRKQSLHEFLSMLDEPADKQSEIINKLYSVDEAYQRAILRDSKQDAQIASVLKGLELDLLSEGFDDLEHDVYIRVSRIAKLFSSKNKYQHQLNQLGLVVEKLELAINSVFGNSSARKRKVLSIDDVEMDEMFYNLNAKYELGVEDDIEELKVLFNETGVLIKEYIDVVRVLPDSSDLSEEELKACRNTIKEFKEYHYAIKAFIDRYGIVLDADQGGGELSDNELEELHDFIELVKGFRNELKSMVESIIE